MNTIGIGALVLFCLGWLGGVTALVFTGCQIVKWHSEGRNSERGRKVLRAAAVFLGFWLLCMSSGAIGAWLGGWRAFDGH
jgi:hypothetical protein